MEEKIIKDLTGNREERIAPKKPAEPAAPAAEKPAFKRPVVRLAQPAEQMQEHLSGKKAGERHEDGGESASGEERKNVSGNERGERRDRNDRHGRNDRRDRHGRNDRGERSDRREPRRAEHPEIAPEEPEQVQAPVEEVLPETEKEVSVTVGNDLSAECSAEKDAERSSGQPEAPAEETTPDEMIEVVGIRFRGAGKTYYFGPNGIRFREGDHAIVETVRGVEYGEVTSGNHCVPAREVVQPLKPVSRRADEIDAIHDRENRAAEQSAKPVFYEKVEKNKLEMQLVDVEYTFDNSKLCFYFTAEGRVDFRELVKDLAGVFRTRIELRQIGVRDEARLFGGLGVCGRPFCCKTFLSDFAQVSIKMAKEQNLSLASAKISGSCGRLMCCLRYEQDTYERENAEMPKKDEVLDTPKGQGAVLESSFLTRKVKFRMLDDNSIRFYTLDELEAVKEGRTAAKAVPAEPEKEGEPVPGEGRAASEQGQRPRNDRRGDRHHGRNNDPRREHRQGDRKPAEPKADKPEENGSEASGTDKPAEDRPRRRNDHHRGRHHRGGNRPKPDQNGQSGQG